MPRVPIKIAPFPEALNLQCEACGSVMSRLESKPHTIIYYCAKCDVHSEVSHYGAVMRSFKKEPQVIFTRGGNE